MPALRALRSLLLASLTLAGVSAAPVPAPSHDWYPPGCCHEMKVAADGSVTGDCGPADLIGQTPEGMVIRQRQSGITVTIPPDFPRIRIKQNTHDGQYHICVSAGDDYETPRGYVYCLFEPQGS